MHNILVAAAAVLVWFGSAKFLFETTAYLAVDIEIKTKNIKH